MFNQDFLQSRSAGQSTPYSLPLFLLAFFLLLPPTNLRAQTNDLCPIINLLLAGSGYKCMASADENSYIHDTEYKGLRYYEPALATSDYILPQLSDGDFNRLSHEQKLRVADKLLSTLFFGFNHQELEKRITSGSFLCTIREELTQRKNNIPQLEEYILNPDYFAHGKYYDNEINDILARLYAMEYLDEYFLHNWQAYILTQTIMFSPAEELESAHDPDVANVYNWLVMDMEDDVSMRYSTYLHMESLENWRRFRSPEDNGREMLEIFLLDFDDTKVPLAATALQNWGLDEEQDTLVIGLNENTAPLKLFNTTVYNGFDFYRELAKSDQFLPGVTSRLVDFFFPASAVKEKQEVINKIVKSKPRRWQDILLQLVFSKEYLLNTERAKSAEELFFSFTKKTSFKHRTQTFNTFNQNLQRMNQAAMKYKLGKLQRVPLDSLSFAYYHQYFRNDILRKYVCGNALSGYESWSSEGWTNELLADHNFIVTEDEPETTMTSYIRYLFHHIVQRDVSPEELNMFLDYTLKDNRTRYQYSFDLQRQGDDGCYSGRSSTTKLVLDYLSRLSEFYWLEGV